MLRSAMEGYAHIEPGVAFVLIATGLIAGVCNALAGGGTFFTFPAFLGAGLPPVVANASNAIAVWPGHVFAAIGYRKELAARRDGMGAAVAVALAGGICGAVLLVFIEDDAFELLIPFLLLVATLLFAAGEKVNRWIAAHAHNTRGRAAMLMEQSCLFAFSLYGGFFGAGLGVILMAGLLILGVTDLAANNALKNFLSAVITSVAVIVFALSGLVSWTHTVAAFSGAAVGGLLGARIAHLLSPQWLRRVVIGVGSVLSLYYFYQYYG